MRTILFLLMLFPMFSMAQFVDVSDEYDSYPDTTNITYTYNTGGDNGFLTVLQNGTEIITFVVNTSTDVTTTKVFTALSGGNHTFTFNLFIGGLIVSSDAITVSTLATPSCEQEWTNPNPNSAFIGLQGTFGPYGNNYPQYVATAIHIIQKPDMTMDTIVVTELNGWPPWPGLYTTYYLADQSGLYCVWAAIVYTHNILPNSNFTNILIVKDGPVCFNSPGLSTSIGCIPGNRSVDISLYPNPTSNGQVTVQNTVLGSQIEIFDTQGKLVEIFSSTESITLINLNHLPDGKYHIRQILMDGTRSSVGLVKSTF